MALASLLAGAAQAHAYLQHASPASGAQVATAPPSLTLTFTQGVNVRFSAVVVRNGQGAEVDKGDLHAAPGNQKRLIIGLQPLKPGSYTVRWNVTSVDTHKTEGTFIFTVGA
jgi:hypothetical protein